MTIGETLRKARRKLRKRQLDIAVELGCTQPTVQAWESDKYQPRSKLVRAIAKAYGVKPEVLLPKAAA